MKPKIRDNAAWERAEILMQPIYIRVVDNIRKYLEQAGKGWAESFVEVQEPHPGYLLRLSRSDASIPAADYDLWTLCFQVCFQHYPGNAIPTATDDPEAEIEVDIDPCLFNEDGEVDWDAIDRKSMAVIQQVLKPLLG